MKKLAFVITGLLVFSTLVPAVASADEPENPNCWGVVTNQFAQTEPGDLGFHAANPPFDTTPDRPGRAGQGNAARVVIGEDAHVSDLGSLLATIDGIEETECP
jgi:hypothetical protein